MEEIYNFSTFGEKKIVLEVWDTKKCVKDKMTGRVAILWRSLEKNPTPTTRRTSRTSSR